MTIDIDKLRKAHAATTQGAWWTSNHDLGLGRFGTSIQITEAQIVACAENVQRWESDADFIALAHNEFPALLDELEQLRRINYQWDQVFGHLGETPDECGNAIHAEFDKRDAEIERLRAQVSEARGLLTEFERTIDNACDGDHPCADEVRAWLENNK